MGPLLPMKPFALCADNVKYQQQGAPFVKAFFHIHLEAMPPAATN